MSHGEPMDGFKPYAPPTAPSPTPARRGYARVVTWVYAGLCGVDVAISMVSFVVPFPPDVHDAAEIVLNALGILELLVGVAWLYGAFREIPERSRRLSPAQAVGFLFVPCANLAWMFAVQWRLGDEIDRVLTAAGRPRGAPRVLAVIAPAVHIISGVATILTMSDGPEVAVLSHVASAATWIAYMLASDRARAEMRVAIAAGASA